MGASFQILKGNPLGPPQGRPRGGGAGGARGGIPQKIVCYVKSGVFNSGESKNDHHFSFQGNPTPQGRPQGGFGGLEGVYHQESCVMSILRFSIVGNPKMITIFILGYPKPQQGRGVVWTTLWPIFSPGIYMMWDTQRGLKTETLNFFDKYLPHPGHFC